MKFCKEVKGREEEKEALCAELYDIMMNKHYLDKYGKEDEEERKISVEIMIFVINHALFHRFNHQAKVLLQKVDDLIGAGKFETVRQVVLKELNDAEEVGGPTSRLVNYVIAEKLAELNWEHYQKSGEPALLEEIVRCGKFVLENNAELALLVKALYYYRKAAERLGDEEKVRSCDKTLAETRDALKLFA